MRRAISIVPAVLAVVGALILVMGQSNSVLSKTGGNCKTRIFKDVTERSYDCNVATEGGATDTMTLDFSEPPPGGPEDFDVLINGSVAGTCACVKKGKNKLEVGRRYRCAMDNISEGDNTSVEDFNIIGSTIEGKPNKKGTKIKGGQGVDNDGDSILYDCTETPAP